MPSDVLDRDAQFVDALFREREARGITWATRARILYATFGGTLSVFTSPSFGDLVVTEGLVLLGVLLCFYMLSLARRQVHLQRAGLLGVSYDLLALYMLPVSWYFAVRQAHPDVSLVFLVKSDAIMIGLSLLAVNALALRPLYLVIFTVGATVQQAIFLALAFADPRTVLTNDPIGSSMGPAMHPWFASWRVLVVALIGAFMVALARSVRSMIRHQVEVELESRRMREDEAERIAEGKMTALASLVAGIAHEVNNPLGALASNVDALGRAAEMDPTHARRDRRAVVLQSTRAGATQAIERIRSLVDSLRAFAQLDRSESGTVDVRAGLEASLALIPETVRGRVEVVREYLEIPRVEGSPIALNQVFHTVLENAFEAIDGEGVVTVRLEPWSDGALVTISDTGRGIPALDLQHVFELRFSSKRRVGMGLGLPTARRIVRDHGGRIEIDSRVGEGTTVRIRLPQTRERSLDSASFD